jgi:predicted phage tail protein
VSVTIAAAPGVPRNLQGRVNGRTVNLTWEAPTDASGVVGFVIEAGGSSGGTDSTVTTTGLAFAIDGVADGVFFIRVRAIRAAGLSAPSNEIVLTVGDGMVPCTVPPAAPANLSAVVNGGTVTLSWHPPLTGEPPTGFVISVGSAPAIADLGAISIDGAGTSFSATAPDGTFFVRVIAVNRCGASATSNEVTVTVGPEPQLPGAPRNLAATVNGSQVALIWDPPVTGGPVTQYVIEVVDASGGVLLTFQSGNTSTLFVQDGVPAGSYVVHVRAANSALGVGPPSNRVVVIVLP